MTMPNDSQCYFVQLQIDTFLDGDLSEQQQDVFMTHVHDCAVCAAELQFARQVHDAVLDLPAIECPEAALEPVYRLGRGGVQLSPFTALANWLAQLPLAVRYAVPAAAAVVLTLLLAPQFLQDNSQPLQVAEQPDIENNSQEYTQEDVVAALADLNTAISYLNEVSQRTETMIGGRFVIMPLQESLNASFERVQDAQDDPLDDDPI